MIRPIISATNILPHEQPYSRKIEEMKSVSSLTSDKWSHKIQLTLEDVYQDVQAYAQDNKDARVRFSIGRSTMNSKEEVYARVRALHPHGDVCSGVKAGTHVEMLKAAGESHARNSVSGLWRKYSSIERPWSHDACFAGMHINARTTGHVGLRFYDRVICNTSETREHQSSERKELKWYPL